MQERQPPGYRGGGIPRTYRPVPHGGHTTPVYIVYYTTLGTPLNLRAGCGTPPGYTAVTGQPRLDEHLQN